MFTEKKKNKAEEMIDKIFQFLDGLFHTPLSLDDFAKKSSDRIDQLILDEAKKGNQFGAGRFYIRLQDANSFKTFVELYFHAKDGEFLNVNCNGNSVGISCLKTPDRMELLRKKEITYAVTDPSKGKAIARETTESASPVVTEPVASKNIPAEESSHADAGNSGAGKGNDANLHMNL